MKNKIFNWLIIIAGLLLTVNLSRSIYQLWKRQDVVKEAKERLEKTEAENAELREEYRRVRRKEYIEETAREKLGLGREGEVVVVLPKDKKKEDSEADSQENEEREGEEAPVWKQWINFYSFWLEEDR